MSLELEKQILQEKHRKTRYRVATPFTLVHLRQENLAPTKNMRTFSCQNPKRLKLFIQKSLLDLQIVGFPRKNRVFSLWFTVLRLNFRLNLKHVLPHAKSSQRATWGHEMGAILRKSNKHNKPGAFFGRTFPYQKDSACCV